MSNPTHFTDQLDAASTDARLRLTRAAQRMGSENMQLGTISEAPWPERQIHARLVEAAGNRHLRWCRHLDTRRPEPCALFAWEQPFTVRCHRCLDAPHLELTGDADRTCDVCGFVEPETIRPHQMTLGPVIVSFGVCHGCWGRV